MTVDEEILAGEKWQSVVADIEDLKPQDGKIKEYNREHGSKAAEDLRIIME